MTEALRGVNRVGEAFATAEPVPILLAFGQVGPPRVSSCLVVSVHGLINFVPKLNLVPAGKVITRCVAAFGLPPGAVGSLDWMLATMPLDFPPLCAVSVMLLV